MINFQVEYRMFNQNMELETKWLYIDVSFHNNINQHMSTPMYIIVRDSIGVNYLETKWHYWTDIDSNKKYAHDSEINQ